MAISYNVTKISDSHYRFDEGNVFMDLVIGEDSALLIDTGFGFGDLRSLIRSITDKPLTVVNTHGHPDHSNANWQFDEVYISPLDFETAAMYDNPEFRTNGAPEEKPDDFLDAYYTAPTGKLVAIEEGQIFDLGGIVIEAVALPGHTAGSTGFFDKTNNELYVGDAANPAIFLFQKGVSQSIDVYRDTLNKIKSLPAKVLWQGHNPGSIDKDSSVDLYIRCAKDLSYENSFPIGEMLDTPDVRLWVLEEFADLIDKDNPPKSVYGDGLVYKEGFASIFCSRETAGK